MTVGGNAIADPWMALVDWHDARPEPPACGAVAVVGATGGCGTSLTAAGVALAVAAADAPVALLELDLERGDLAAAWGIPPARTLDDLVGVQAELTVAHLRLIAHPHPANVMLLAAPARTGAACAWDGPATRRLIAAASQLGRVVIDCGAVLSEAAQRAIADAERVLLVAPATIRGARRVRAIAREIDRLAGAGRVELVVNRSVGREPLGAQAFAKAAGMVVAAVLARSDRDAERIGAGTWSSGRRDRLAQTFAALAVDRG